MENKKFPSEIIDLPSGGYFYDPESSLSSGTIEIRYMTARDEDILTSRNLIQKGVVLDKLLQSLIVSPMNYEELLVGDKNAVLFASRILAYGKDYNIEMPCPSCDVKNKVEIDLTTIDPKEVDLKKNFPEGNRTVEFELPASKVTVTLQILNNRDEKMIEEALKGMKKLSNKTGMDYEVTTRLKYIIVAVNGDRDRKKINDFIDNDLLSRDSLDIRVFLKDVTPDIDATFMFECSECGDEREVNIPLQANFFWPNTRSKTINT